MDRKGKISLFPFVCDKNLTNLIALLHSPPERLLVKSISLTPYPRSRYINLCYTHLTIRFDMEWNRKKYIFPFNVNV